MDALPLTIGFRGRIAGRWLAGLALSLVLLFGAHSTALAQQGTVTGLVTDAESGEPVSGVVVELVVGSGSALRTATTDSDGSFRITGVAGHPSYSG